MIILEEFAVEKKYVYYVIIKPEILRSLCISDLLLKRAYI